MEPAGAGARIFTCDDGGGVIEWDPATGKSVKSVGPQKSPAHAIALAADGKTLALGCADGLVVIADAETGKEIRHVKVSDAVNSLAFSPDGTILAIATQNEELPLVDAATARQTKVLKGHSRPICSVVFSPDGAKLVSGSMDMTVRVWPMK